jgi:predicted metalloprotease
VNRSSPNPFQPLIDAAVSAGSKLIVALLLGFMVYVAVVFAFRFARGGGPPDQFSDFVGRAAMGFSMLFFLYVGFVVMEPTKTGAAQSAAAEASPQIATPTPPKKGAPTDEMGSMIAGILGEVDDRWSETFQAGGQTYPEPRIVLFRNATDGGRCGVVQATMGPFYCAPDQRIFLDTGYFREIEARLPGCPGSTCRAAAAYIIARQVGHHVQNLLGILPKVMQAQQQAASKVESNAMQVRVELQADCLSGVWFNREEKKRPGVFDAADIDAVLKTASALGDYTLQQQATGQVAPDSFTHGSAAQRKQWFTTGYQQGTFQACNTFAAGAL